MSDPTQPIQVVACQSNSSWLYLAAGAVLALVGGSITTVIKMRLEKKQEIQYIKTSLVDEIGEIVATICNMLQTHEAAKSLPKVYFDDLLSNTESFDMHKKRLFLIGDKKLRKEIGDFYKKLEKDAKSAISIVGTLDETNTEQVAKVAKVIADFTAMKIRASDLEKSVEKYKYKALWIF